MNVKATLIAALIVALSIGTATGVQRAVLSLFSEELASSQALTLILTFMPILTFGLLKGLADLVAGMMSDRFGRKPVVLLGTLSYAFGMLLMFESHTIMELSIANVLIGWSQGLVDAAIMIVLSDVGGAERQGLSMGLMEGFIYGGYAFGSISSGWVAEIRGLRDSFLIGLLFSTLALIAAILLSETRGKDVEEAQEMSTSEAYRKCFESTTLRMTFVLGHIDQFSDALVWASLPLLLNQLGYSKLEIGIVQGANTFTWAVLMPFSGRISDLFGRKIPMMAGIILKAIGLLIFSFHPPLPHSIALSSMIGAGVGLYYPVVPAVVADSSPPYVRGRALGLYRGIRDMGYATGSLALGLISQFLGLEAGFLVTPILLFLALPALIAMKETRPFWPAFNLVLEHVSKVKGCVEELGNMVNSYYKGSKGVESLKRIKALENEADDVKVRIDRQLWLSSLSGQDKADFARLVGRIDRIASFALGASRSLNIVDPDKIPGKIKELLPDMVKISLWAMNRLYKAVKLAREDVDKALEVISEIDSLEAMFDELHLRAMEELKYANMDVVQLLSLRDFLERFENLVDSIEDASDVLRVIIFKHMAWPT